MTVVGRRNPPALPDITRLNWEQARLVIWQHLNYQGDAYDGHPAPHQETHLLGASDALQFPGTPADISAGGTGDAGAGPSFAAEDHVHGAAIGTPVALGTAEAAGTGPAFAASNHVHARAIEVQLNDAAFAIRRLLDFKDSASLAWSLIDNAGAFRVEVSASPTGAVSVVTPAQITANQNDYAPAAGEIVRLSSDAARNVTGLAAGSSGARRCLVNVGAFNITLKHQDAASAAANRFQCQGGADIVMTPDFSACAWYDATTARWRAYAT